MNSDSVDLIKRVVENTTGFSKIAEALRPLSGAAGRMDTSVMGLLVALVKAQEQIIALQAEMLQDAKRDR